MVQILQFSLISIAFESTAAKIPCPVFTISTLLGSLFFQKIRAYLIFIFVICITAISFINDNEVLESIYFFCWISMANCFDFPYFSWSLLVMALASDAVIHWVCDTAGYSDQQKIKPLFYILYIPVFLFVFSMTLMGLPNQLTLWIGISIAPILYLLSTNKMEEFKVYSTKSNDAKPFKLDIGSFSETKTPEDVSLSYTGSYQAN
ncbi:hypothetical protein N9Y17_01300 [Gammaproteobacteria bacterium]|nr:hypothetical protein [Gammaproteobacteria bacterium]